MYQIYLQNIRKSELKNHKQKKLLLSSAITFCILLPSYAIPRPLINYKSNEINKYQNKSFITNAVEKTGSSVVTIETQRYVKKRKLAIMIKTFLLDKIIFLLTIQNYTN